MDWLLSACIVFHGKARVIQGISVHRELGATAPYLKQVARAKTFPWQQNWFPRSTMAAQAYREFYASKNPLYGPERSWKRWAFAVAIALVILVRGALRAPGRLAGKLFALLRRG